MKVRKFTDARKAFILKQAEEGLPVGEVCRKAGISVGTSICDSAARTSSSARARTRPQA